MFNELHVTTAGYLRRHRRRNYEDSLSHHEKAASQPDRQMVGSEIY